MKRIIIMCTLIFLAGCSFTPKPMKYMAVDMPAEVITPNQKSEYVEVIEHKVGIYYRESQDISLMVTELQNEAQADILRNADVRVRIPFCFFVCYGYDTAFAGELE